MERELVDKSLGASVKAMREDKTRSLIDSLVEDARKRITANILLELVAYDVSLSGEKGTSSEILKKVYEKAKKMGSQNAAWFCKAYELVEGEDR